MIIQGLINALVTMITALMVGIPDVPVEFTQALSMIADGGIWMSGLLGKLGVIIPWNVITSCLVLWAGAMVFWLAMGVLRLILWVFGR